MTLSCIWPINPKNETNNASSLSNWISHFFLPLVFPHVSAFKSNLPVHMYLTYIRIISVTQDSSGSIGNWACVEVAILNTIFTVQLTLAYPDLASTQFQIHSVFKNFHSGEPIQNVADSYAGSTGYVWTKAKSGNESHTSRTRTLWGRADTRHVSFWISCFYNGIVYSFFFWNYKSLLRWLNLLVDKY